MTEMRCATCIGAGIECPRGYYSGVMKCDVCGFRFVLAKARYAPDITCPKCNGTVDEDEDQHGHD